MIPAAIVSLSLLAKVMGDLSAQSEAKQASRVGRIESAVSRIAASIAADLASAKAAGSVGDVLTAVKAASVAAGADYLLSAMPDTLKAAGASKPSLITMIESEVSKHQLTAAALASPSAPAATAAPPVLALAPANDPRPPPAAA
jgi:hypothetical protein